MTFSAKSFLIILLSIACGYSSAAPAQVPVSAAPDQLSLLSSADPQLARNKRLVFDFWRVVLEAGQLDRVDEFLDDNYIQHNPTAPTGKAGFLQHFTGRIPLKPVQQLIAKEVVALQAEGDLVTVATVRHVRGATASENYTTTAFDMFRIRNGKILEHWDAGLKAK